MRSLSPPLLEHRSFTAGQSQGTQGADDLYSGITAGGFGLAGALFALQFFAEVPKVRTDICQVRTFTFQSGESHIKWTAVWLWGNWLS